jgi:hypothetical protein
VRRTTAGLTAFIAMTGAFIVLPVYVASGPAPEPVAPSVDTIALGSFEASADSTELAEDTVGGAPAAPAAPTAPAEPTGSRPAVGQPADGEDVDEVAPPATGEEIPGLPALTVSRPESAPFSAVGVTWERDDSVEEVVAQVRVRAEGGSWGSWTRLEKDDAEQTDPGDGVRDGTAPYYTGPASGMEVIVQALDGSSPQDVRIELIDPGTSPADAAVSESRALDEAEAATPMPPIYSRAQWGADESIRAWDPSYAPSIKAATIHHTADKNSYTADAVPGIMRAIYAYHTISRGWGDIGYNVIVDKFGRAWEGRYSGDRGIASPVVGAHAGGFNTGTFGVSMLGDYSTTTPSEAVVDTVAALVAWKLSLYGVDPRGTTTLVSGGGGTAKYAAGTSVRVPTVFGHRDVGSTSCPGQAGYAKLGDIRTRAAAAVAASMAHDPRGSVDSLAVTPSGVTAAGWAYDPDAVSSRAVVGLVIDGAKVSGTSVTEARPDVDAAFGVGPDHGFRVSALLAHGVHDVCVFVENSAGPGSAVRLGCAEVNFTNRAPVFSVDQFAEQADGTVRISGWAFDPDGSPPELQLYDNDRGRAYATTVARPDVHAAFPAAGPTAGFAITVGPLTGGHRLCLFVADTVAAGNNVFDGCRDVRYREPLGSLDNVVETTTGELRVTGWAMDESSAQTALDVHVYVNGRGTAIGAGGSRPDIGRAFPGAGDAHGFDATLPAGAGSNRVCAFAINVGIGGVNPLLGCRTVSTEYVAPDGVVDAYAPVGDGRLRVSGWAVDRSVPSAPVGVHFYVDGQYQRAVQATNSRPDIASAFPGAGPQHGFSEIFDLTPGQHSVCVFAINLGTAGTNPLMGCRTVTVHDRSPVGSVDSIGAVGAGQLRVSGWAFDPDAPTRSTTVQVSVDGVDQGSFAADASRPDVGRVYPEAGAAHGFSIDLAVPSGLREVCVSARSTDIRTTPTLMRCAQVTV